MIQKAGQFRQIKQRLEQKIKESERSDTPMPAEELRRFDMQLKKLGDKPPEEILVILIKKGIDKGVAESRRPYKKRNSWVCSK